MKQCELLILTNKGFQNFEDLLPLVCLYRLWNHVTINEMEHGRFFFKKKKE